jgi:hypothetical protein
VKSDIHTQRIDDLRAVAAPTWGERALLSALATLARAMEISDHVEIIQAWVDADYTIRIVYMAPWRTQSPVGLVRVRREEPHPYFVYDDEDHQTPEEYGENIAVIDVNTPLGTVASRLVYDRNGVGWWGDGFTD